MQYRVTWALDNIEADSPELAARRARSVQLTPSVATAFVVREEPDGDDVVVEVPEEKEEPIEYAWGMAYFDGMGDW